MHAEFCPRCGNDLRMQTDSPAALSDCPKRGQPKWFPKSADQVASIIARACNRTAIAVLSVALSPFTFFCAGVYSIGYVMLVLPLATILLAIGTWQFSSLPKPKRLPLAYFVPVVGLTVIFAVFLRSLAALEPEIRATIIWSLFLPVLILLLLHNSHRLALAATAFGGHEFCASAHSIRKFSQLAGAAIAVVVIVSMWPIWFSLLGLERASKAAEIALDTLLISFVITEAVLWTFLFRFDRLCDRVCAALRSGELQVDGPEGDRK